MFARLFVSALALTQAVLALPLQKRAFNGEATHYAVGLGACGNYNNDGELVVAMNAAQYSGGAHCGQSVTISLNGKTATATVVDLCPGCAFGDLDMSPTLFQIFNPLGVGRFDMSWSFGGGGGGEPAPPPPPKETPPPPPPPAPTSEYTPPPYTPPPAPETSEAPPPPPAPETSAAAPSPSSSSSEAAPPSSSASSSAVPSSSSSIVSSSSSSVASTISASLNSTSIASNTTVLPTTTASALNMTHPTSSSSKVPVDVVVSNTASDEEAGGNLATLNSLVATFGRLVVIAAQ